MYTCIQVPFHKTVCHPSTAPLWCTLVSQTPENLFLVLVNHVHVSCLFCMDLTANRSVPAFAIGCACVILSWLPAVYFIVAQLFLGHKAPLLFLKDIWSSFLMCLLGKPETSSMPILQGLLFQEPEPWGTCIDVCNGCRVLGLFTKEVLKSLQTHLYYMHHLGVHNFTGNEL